MKQALVGIDFRVFRDADGTVFVVPPEMDFAPQPGMHEIHGVRDIKINISLGEAVTADIELLPGFYTPLQAIPDYYVVDPNGAQKALKRIEFGDGTAWPDDYWPATKES